jgi:hypothetical protein
MSTAIKRPREFWIIQAETRLHKSVVWDTAPGERNFPDLFTHVIEYSAYEQAVKEWDSWKSVAQNYKIGYVALENENKRLKIALEEIDNTLRVPAAEYVPAISDVFTIIDKLKTVSR